MFGGCADALSRHGNQGTLDTASNGTLEQEFGTSNDDDVVKQILEKGTILETEVSSKHLRVCVMIGHGSIADSLCTPRTLAVAETRISPKDHKSLTRRRIQSECKSIRYEKRNSMSMEDIACGSAKVEERPCAAMALRPGMIRYFTIEHCLTQGSQG